MIPFDNEDNNDIFINTIREDSDIEDRSSEFESQEDVPDEIDDEIDGTSGENEIDEVDYTGSDAEDHDYYDDHCGDDDYTTMTIATMTIMTMAIILMADRVTIRSILDEVLIYSSSDKYHYFQTSYCFRFLPRKIDSVCSDCRRSLSMSLSICCDDASFDAFLSYRRFLSCYYYLDVCVFSSYVFVYVSFCAFCCLLLHRRPPNYHQNYSRRTTSLSVVAFSFSSFSLV